MILHIFKSGEVETNAATSSLPEAPELRAYIEGAWRKVRTYFPIEDKPTHGIVTSDPFLEGFLINQELLRHKDKERIAFLEKEVARLFELSKEEKESRFNKE